MTSIAQQVWRLLDDDPAVQECLARGIINMTGLAAYLQKKRKLGGSNDAIVSAIRRYKATTKSEEERRAVADALAAAIISTKTRITAVMLKNSPSLYKYISEMMRDPEFYKSEVFKLIKSRNETLCLIEQEAMEKAKPFFTAGNLIGVEEGIAELAITLTREGWETRGILARITSELAARGVNIRYIIHADPRISIYVDADRLPRAHEAALALTKE